MVDFRGGDLGCQLAFRPQYRKGAGREAKVRERNAKMENAKWKMKGTFWERFHLSIGVSSSVSQGSGKVSKGSLGKWRLLPKLQRSEIIVTGVAGPPLYPPPAKRALTH